MGFVDRLLLAALLDVDVRTVSEHLQNIFTSGELAEASVIRKFRITAADGKSYTTALDYSTEVETTQTFFAAVQNKLHFAIHSHTAAELIVERADSAKEHMGLTTWRNAPKGKILKPDVVVAKNYLTEKELKALDRFVTMYLDYAEDQAERGIPMTMADWAKKLDAFLQFNQRDLFDHPGKVTAEIAKVFAESEFEKYRIVQDRLFESDFDIMLKQLPKSKEQPS